MIFRDTLGDGVPHVVRIGGISISFDSAGLSTDLNEHEAAALRATPLRRQRFVEHAPVASTESEADDQPATAEYEKPSRRRRRAADIEAPTTTEEPIP